MASGSPERPVVLRRLGIVKDEKDTEFLQPRPVQVNTAEDGLEAFGSEAKSATFNGIAGRAAAMLAYAARNPWVPVVLISSVLLVAAVLLLSALSGPPEPSVAAAGVGDTVPANAEAAVSGREKSSTRVAASKPAAGVSATARTATSRSVATPSVRRSDTTVGRNASRVPELAPLRAADVHANVQPSAEAETSAPVAPPVELAAPVVDDRIYSAEDTDVIPPRTSEMLPTPTISSWTTRTNAMEVIVSETGAVEHVRLVGAPQRMPDVLVLSRAKVWKFSPAMKDGRPVRYRLLLRWEVNP